MMSLKIIIKDARRKEKERKEKITSMDALRLAGFCGVNREGV